MEEYQDQNYEAKNPLPSYAQHEELTQEAVENIYRDIDEKLDNKKSPYDVVKFFLLEYNTNMGEVLNENISDKVQKLAKLKGELYHASEYLSEIRGLITPNSSRTDTEENIYSRIAQTIGTESTGNSRRTSRTKETRSYSLRQESASRAEKTGRGLRLGFERSGYIWERKVDEQEKDLTAQQQNG